MLTQLEILEYALKRLEYEIAMVGEYNMESRELLDRKYFIEAKIENEKKLNKLMEERNAS